MTDPVRSARAERLRAGVEAAAEEARQGLRDLAARRPDLGGRVRDWLAQVDQALARAGDAEVRVALVGAVKSGKSTLANALVGRDALPRGAGVLTAQVTELVPADRPGTTVTWRSRAAVNRAFSLHLEALGRPGRWDLWNPGHRAAARALLDGPPSPHRTALAALLGGFDAVADRLADTPRDELLPPGEDLWGWVTRDEVATFLEAVRVEIPAPDLPAGAVLVDCPGVDAWNAAHGAVVDRALLGAHAIVYVISGRVGLREADLRFLEALRGYGLLPITRFVLNADLSELRGPADLARVAGAVERDLRGLGVGEEPAAFSALLGLLDRLALLDPERLAPGEARLREAWEGSPLAAPFRDAFRAFRDELWARVEAERDRLVLARCRADLRRVMVEALAAAGGTSPLGLGRGPWRADTADALLGWLSERMAGAAEREKDRIAAELRRGFGRRRSPHRRAWAARVAELDPAAPDYRDRIEAVLAATEPLRVNAVRNLALEARGALARAGEALAREAAEALEKAGLAPGGAPDRRALSRQITATRRIPLFRGTAGTSDRRTGLWDRLRAGGRAGAAARRAGAVLALERAWSAYLERVEADCLAPHVDEAAAQVYDALAEWVLGTLGGPGDPRPKP